MNETVLNILKNLLAVVIFASPLISFLIVRKRKWDKNLKIGLGIIIAIVTSLVSYALVMLIVYRVGIFQ